MALKSKQVQETEIETIPLGELVSNYDSKRIPLSTMERTKRKGNFPYYGATTIIDFVDDYIFDGIFVLLGEDGSVIHDDGTPFVQYVDGKFWTNNHVHVLKTNEKILPRFLFYALRSVNVEGFTTGTVQLKINQNNLNNIPIPYFSLPEQEQIGKTLFDLDTKIQNLQNQNCILEQTAQAIFKSWFVDFDGVTEFEDSELGKIPKGWKAVLFNEFGECVKGFSYKGIEKFNTTQGFEFVTLNSIKEGGGFKKRVTWLESDRLKERHFVKELDLIIANTEQTKDARLLATPALVQFSHDYTKELAVYSHHITRIDSKVPNSKFYLYSLFLYQQKIIANAYHTGTGVWGFDHTGFSENHFIIKPNQDILNNFEKLSFEIHSNIIKNEKSISILTKTRDTLLPKLMSGEIRV